MNETSRQHVHQSHIGFRLITSRMLGRQQASQLRKTPWLELTHNLEILKKVIVGQWLFDEMSLQIGIFKEETRVEIGRSQFHF